LASVQYAAATRLYPGTTSPAVNELNLDIEDGELLVLVGPSGSGKSTALRMLAGLEPLDAGHILIGGKDVSTVRPRDRDIAMVFQNYALYPQLDVAANMGFSLKQHGVPKEERRTRVLEVAKLLDLEPYLDRKPRNLSGGQRQRVAMGRAIVRHPQVYLMDEPLSNLDAKLRVQTRTELVELQQRLAVTTVYVTHDQVEAMTMGHRVAVLRDGELQQCDTPSTLYHAPANLFVAGFIGSPAMNMLSVANGGGPLRVAGAELGVTDELGTERATIGFRPETVVIGDGPIPARIRTVEDLGSEVFVHLLIDHNGDEHRLVAKVDPPFAGLPGENVRVDLRGTLHLFDESGTRRMTYNLESSTSVIERGRVQSDSHGQARRANAPVPLADATLPTIASLGVAVPHYDRAALVPRILHIGVGGFHRAHMAFYTDELALAGSDWGIRGLGLVADDRRMAEALVGQDHLYTLIERDTDSSEARVVGSIVGFTLAIGDEASAADRIADPAVAILSMTITEGGYSAPQENATIQTIAAGLEARRIAGGPALTILSCDNMPGNGSIARAAIVAVAETRSDDLLRYIETQCTFPNSMVDRITPQTTHADRAWLSDSVGIYDRWPVVTESFRQWVVEDEFAAGRPRWEDAGVLFSNRVHDWEIYKLRMLNAAHSSMAYLMALAGVVHVDEALAIPTVRRYLERFLTTEAIPTLAEIPGHPPIEYAQTVLARLANHGVRDQIARLCLDGTSKFPSFLTPTIEGQLAIEGPLECAALALAAWARYLATTPADERAPDPHADRATELATRSLADPTAFLELEGVFTARIRQSDRFRRAFVAASNNLASLDPLGAMNELLSARK
jgi:ABC-type sugar transport system ATPase subunit/mannitol-1-phosphate/altronate dehydrogenase